jgi:DHA2 family methylenomycin A resistance protein-like MFS transporter
MDTSVAGKRPGDRTSWLPLIAVALGYFMVILDATAVNLALPAVSKDLGGGVTGLQWVVDGYTLAFAALLLSAGVAGDRLGSRRVFLTGLATFTAASAGCALAPALGVLVVIRLIQGVAAAMLVPTSLALLQASYPDRAMRARAIGLWGGIGGLAAASGPVLGGALTTAASWRLVFAINVPVGLFAWWLTRRRVAAPTGARGRRADPVGQLTAIVALTALTAGLIEAGPYGWASWPVLAGLIVAALAGAAFLAAQYRVASPMLPPALLRRPTLTAGSFVGLLINLGFYGQLFVFSLYLQQVQGKSPLIAGLSLLPEAAAVPVASVLSGRLTARRGPRMTMITGLSLGAAGLLGLIVAAHGVPYWMLILPMVAAGSGMALTMPAVTTAVMEAAPASRGGAAAGLLNSARQAGSALGVAIAGALVGGAAGFVPGLHLALAICGSAFLLGVVVTVARVSRPAGGQPEPGQPAAELPPARGGQAGGPPAARAAGQYPGRPDSVSRDPGRGGGTMPVRGTGR